MAEEELKPGDRVRIKKGRGILDALYAGRIGTVLSAEAPHPVRLDDSPPGEKPLKWWTSSLEKLIE